MISIDEELKWSDLINRHAYMHRTSPAFVPISMNKESTKIDWKREAGCT